MRKTKVLILYNKLFHYRIPIWNILAEKCDLTVAYSDNQQPPKEVCHFKVLYLPYFTVARRFVIQKDNIRRLSKKYDVVIAYGDISWLKYSTLPWFSQTKVIFWSLGVSASYQKGFDTHKNWDRIRCFFYNKADALVFYTDYPIKKYEKMGIIQKKMFEAPNTVFVEQIEEKTKDSLLFIGSLYRQKGLQYLLDAYYQLSQSYKLPLLNVIGNGPDFDVIKEWIIKHELSEFVNLRGAIYDSKEKSVFFAKALACISPMQAGLSVLESMGYGVPFITTKDAITGGEIFNIHNGVDGLIMDDCSQLQSVLLDIISNKLKYIAMGKSAKSFYDKNRTPEDMANGLFQAIKYVIDK